MSEPTEHVVRYAMVNGKTTGTCTCGWTVTAPSWSTDPYTDAEQHVREAQS